MANQPRDPNSKNSQKRELRKLEKYILDNYPVQVMLAHQLNTVEWRFKRLSVEVTEHGEILGKFQDYDKAGNLRNRTCRISLTVDPVRKCSVCGHTPSPYNLLVCGDTFCGANTIVVD